MCLVVSCLSREVSHLSSCLEDRGPDSSLCLLSLTFVSGVSSVSFVRSYMRVGK